MAHHGDNLPEELRGSFFNDGKDQLVEALKRQVEGIKEKMEIGATGKFPEGQLCDDDEGEICFQIGSNGAKVVMDFGKPTAWIGMNPQQAGDVASSLIEHARKAAKAAGVILRVEIGLDE
jgi:hypothetical protein